MPYWSLITTKHHIPDVLLGKAIKASPLLFCAGISPKTNPDLYPSLYGVFHSLQIVYKNKECLRAAKKFKQ